MKKLQWQIKDNSPPKLESEWRSLEVGPFPATRGDSPASSLRATDASISPDFSSALK